MSRRRRCQKTQDNGKRCRNFVSEFFPEDGLCGMHWNKEFAHSYELPSLDRCVRCGLKDGQKETDKCFVPNSVWMEAEVKRARLEMAALEVKRGLDAAQRIKSEPIRTRVQPRKRTKRAGFVYLVRCGEFYKIGVSQNPEQRIKQFATVKLPFNFECVHTIKTRDSYGLEARLHNRFQAQRVNGEWFGLTQADVEAIKSGNIL